jgi:hypothetical protein
MKEITIRQKDSINHTKFYITSSGRPVPEANFKIAVAWMEFGQLDDQNNSLMREIIEGRK